MIKVPSMSTGPFILKDRQMGQVSPRPRLVDNSSNQSEVSERTSLLLPTHSYSSSLLSINEISSDDENASPSLLESREASSSLSSSQNNFNIQEVVLVVESVVKCSYKKTLPALGVILLGASTGAAMIPIFNQEFDELVLSGVNISEAVSSALLTAVSINTFITQGVIALNGAKGLIGSFNCDRLTCGPKEIAVILGAVVGAGLYTMLPVGILWDAMVYANENPEETGIFEGVENYKLIGWLAFGPIVISHFIEYIKSLLDDEEFSSSCGIPVLLCIVSRTVSTTAVLYQMSDSAYHEEEDWNIPMLTFTGTLGLLSGLASAAVDCKALSSFASANRLKKAAIIALCLTEGAWINMPAISIVGNLIPKIGFLAKSSLLIPLLIPRAVVSACQLYEGFKNFPKCGEDYRNCRVDI